MASRIIALGPGFDDYREGDYAVPGYVALVGGTVIGAYALKLRYLKAYFAVGAGVFGLVVIVVAAVSVTGYSS